MDVIQLNNTKENELKFDVNVEKVNTSDLEVRFVIKTSLVNFSFKGIQESDNGKWVITIPPLPVLERSAFPFCIEVITDGYFFETLIGTVNVIGSHQVYTSNVVNTTLSPPEIVSPNPTPTDNTNKVVLTINDKKLQEKSAEDIAEEILKNDKSLKDKEKTASKGKANKKVTESKAKPTQKTEIVKDDKVKKILKSIGTNKTPISKTTVRKGKTVIH